MALAGGEPFAAALWSLRRLDGAVAVIATPGGGAIQGNVEASDS
jgi:hypothetical protein